GERERPGGAVPNDVVHEHELGVVAHADRILAAAAAEDDVVERVAYAAGRQHVRGGVDEAVARVDVGAVAAAVEHVVRQRHGAVVLHGGTKALRGAGAQPHVDDIAPQHGGTEIVHAVVAAVRRRTSANAIPDQPHIAGARVVLVLTLNVDGDGLV